MSLQDKLKSHPEYPALALDGIELLAIIKEVTYTFEERRNLADSLCDVKEHFYCFKQGRTMSLQRYHELFLAEVEVMEQVGITIEDDSFFLNLSRAPIYFGSRPPQSPSVQPSTTPTFGVSSLASTLPSHLPFIVPFDFSLLFITWASFWAGS